MPDEGKWLWVGSRIQYGYIFHTTTNNLWLLNDMAVSLMSGDFAVIIYVYFISWQ